jgi:phytoene synthase
MALCDRRAMRPARIMSATYRAVLSALQRRGWSRPDEQVHLPKWKKLAIAVRHAFR